MLDLVYIVKPEEKNEDLRYSLRSVAKFVPHEKIWIVGYKPSWIQNVNYISTVQKGTKWDNSIINIIAACQSEQISDNFVLMNDDFFAIKPIKDLEYSINISLGSLATAVKKYEKASSQWKKAFKQVYDLLKELNIPEPYYNYESHTPLIINKQKYLEVMKLPEVIRFRKTSKVLHKRSLYKNIDKITPRIISRDIKTHRRIDDTQRIMNICDWLSVYDDQVGNPAFATLNGLLQTLFPEPCEYEIPKTHTINNPSDILNEF